MELKQLIATGSSPPRLDVRTPQEHANGTVPGAVNIEVDALRDRIKEAKALANNGELVVFCQVGMRGYLATRILLQHGICARNLSGGYTSWARA